MTERRATARVYLSINFPSVRSGVGEGMTT